MKNKLLASILTACMLLTMLPTAAFAAETEAESGTEQTATATEQSDPVTEDAGDQTEGTADGTDNVWDTVRDLSQQVCRGMSAEEAAAEYDSRQQQEIAVYGKQ